MFLRVITFITPFIFFLSMYIILQKGANVKWGQFDFLATKLYNMNAGQNSATGRVSTRLRSGGSYIPQDSFFVEV